MYILFRALHAEKSHIFVVLQSATALCITTNNAAMYNVRLPNFEGPLDLLLFFIKRDELDIYDIPISKIAKEFLEYTRIIKLLDLELAGEFLVMAATLMQIKAKMLLPVEDVEGVKDEIEDPRSELVRRLIEYKRFKEASVELQTREEEYRTVLTRSYYEGDVKTEPEEDELKNVTLFHLLSALRTVLAKAQKRKTVHTVERFAVTIEQQVDFILSCLLERREVTFLEIMEDKPKQVIIVTFLAILEMVKSRMIACRQDDSFEDILIYQL